MPADTVTLVLSPQGLLDRVLRVTRFPRDLPDPLSINPMCNPYVRVLIHRQHLLTPDKRSSFLKTTYQVHTQGGSIFR